jgi:hypothetical protein
MTSASSTSKRIRRLANSIPNESRLRGFFRVLENRHVASDYPIAIMGGAMIERALEAGILSRCVALDKDGRNRLFSFDFKGPLADLSARIKMGAALGLYGNQTQADLDCIRQIRNAFAHSPSLLSFNAEDIALACSKLHIFRQLTTAESEYANDTPKGRYTSACLAITGRLRSRLQTLTVAKVRAKYASFPRQDGLLP